MEFSIFAKKWDVISKNKYGKLIDAVLFSKNCSKLSFENVNLYLKDAENDSLLSENETVGDAVKTGMIRTYHYMDKLSLVYPSELFFIDTNALPDTLTAKNGSVKIAIAPQIGVNDSDATMEYYDTYADYDQYSTTVLKICGYNARIITYFETWFGYCAEVHIDFGKNTYISGVNFSIESEVSMKNVMSSDVMAIIQSVKVAAK